MIAAIYIEQYEDLINTPQTINLGGKYLYKFEPKGDTIIVTREINEQYVEGFFDISGSGCKVDLVTAIVGENGVGKTRSLYLLQFIKSNQDNNLKYCIVQYLYNRYFYTINGIIISIADQHKDEEIITTDNGIGYSSLFYYSPYMELKSNKIFDDYSFSIDSYFKNDLDILNKKELVDTYEYLKIENNKRNMNFLLSDVNEKIHSHKYFNQYKYSDLKFHLGEMFFEIDSNIIINSELLERILVSSIADFFNNNTVNDASEKFPLEIYKISDLSDKLGNIGYGYDFLGDINSLYKEIELLTSHRFMISENKEIVFKDIPIEYVIKIKNLANSLKYNLMLYFLNHLDNNRTCATTSSDLLNNIDWIDDFISFEPSYNLSSGESSFLHFFSRLYNHPDLSQCSTNILLLLDEADLGFHPMWKKKFLKSILETICYFFEESAYRHDSPTKLQIIFTTHDPLTLSDMPNNNVVFLKKNENGKTIVLNNEDKARPRKTFGANITDILSNAFFVEDGLIGDFAKHKIEEVIHWINEQKKDKSKNFDSELAHNKKVIALIDEPVIRRKLTEMLTDLAPDNKYYNDAIEAQIKYLQSLKK